MFFIFGVVDDPGQPTTTTTNNNKQQQQQQTTTTSPRNENVRIEIAAMSSPLPPERERKKRRARQLVRTIFGYKNACK